jgi:hypothetical protein
MNSTTTTKSLGHLVANFLRTSAETGEGTLTFTYEGETVYLRRSDTVVSVSSDRASGVTGAQSWNVLGLIGLSSLTPVQV